MSLRLTGIFVPRKIDSAKLMDGVERAAYEWSLDVVKRLISGWSIVASVCRLGRRRPEVGFRVDVTDSLKMPRPIGAVRLRYSWAHNYSDFGIGVVREGENQAGSATPQHPASHAQQLFRDNIESFDHQPLALLPYTTGKHCHMETLLLWCTNFLEITHTVVAGMH